MHNPIQFIHSLYGVDSTTRFGWSEPQCCIHSFTYFGALLYFYFWLPYTPHVPCSSGTGGGAYPIIHVCIHASPCMDVCRQATMYAWKQAGRQTCRHAPPCIMHTCTAGQLKDEFSHKKHTYCWIPEPSTIDLKNKFLVTKSKKCLMDADGAA